MPWGPCFRKPMMGDTTHPAVLMVEDSPSLAATYEEYLRDEAIELVHAATGQQALVQIGSLNPAVVLLDLKLPDMDGIEILEALQKARSPAIIIVITAHGSVNVAVEAMRLGAADFLMKPFTADRLRVTLRNALEKSRLLKIVEVFQETFARHEFAGFIGSSRAMQAVYRMIDAAAPSRATVFITGESGTGKELCAEAIHQRSSRREGPFVALNCAAIPKDLMESEIFGHVKGAFTSAISDRDGAAQQADGGTFFLDEICELDINLQTKLLRFIQTGTFSRVGGDAMQKVDVRFLCATNRDPLVEVETGRFREDLYYRLHVIPIPLPPLRERETDVLDLARFFLESFAAEEGRSFDGFDPQAEAILRAYSWPGNVRELQNVIRNIVVMNAGGLVTPEYLPPPLNMLSHAGSVATGAGLDGAASDGKRPGGGNLPAGGGRVSDARLPARGVLRPLAEVERETIEEALRLFDGNVPRTATELGISASTIYRKIRSWEKADQKGADRLTE